MENVEERDLKRTDVVRRFNEQLRRNQTYKNMVEMNYFEINFSKHEISYEMSKKFKKTNNIHYKKFTLSMNIMLKFVHRDNRNTIKQLYKELKQLELGEEVHWDAHKIIFPHTTKAVWMIATIQRV